MNTERIVYVSCEYLITTSIPIVSLAPPEGIILVQFTPWWIAAYSCSYELRDSLFLQYTKLWCRRIEELILCRQMFGLSHK